MTVNWKTLDDTQLRRLKALVFLTALLPLALLMAAAWQDNLGANPIEKITHNTGYWTLTLLLISLGVTPLRQLSGANWLFRLRRMLGLFAFFYACLHFLTYLVLDQFFDWSAIAKDILKRPYITVGFAAFVLLIPLAVTSTNAMQRRLGGKNWKRLHSLVYLIASAGVVHFAWLVKKDLSRPLLFGGILALLLALRWFYKLKSARLRRSYSSV
ncbi:sulfoxide reductase heme-binding subunit YedZ [Methylomonas methanica]|uniref:Protein-methionine-sulfoxide reductase heme-binding subunit MsrQ n=1 Tax=Methylomonas methanica TaxID=421 RepID=A0ABY2CJK6_METMH|nr:sulfoxide reductase heme-binding subunit YedZ [Methylomonas methanica]